MERNFFFHMKKCLKEFFFCPLFFMFFVFNFHLNTNTHLPWHLGNVFCEMFSWQWWWWWCWLVKHHYTHLTPTFIHSCSHLNWKGEGNIFFFFIFNMYIIIIWWWRWRERLPSCVFSSRVEFMVIFLCWKKISKFFFHLNFDFLFFFLRNMLHNTHNNNSFIDSFMAGCY